MGVGALAVLTATLAVTSGQWLVASGQCVTGVTLTSGQWLVASGQGVTGTTLSAAAPLPAVGGEFAFVPISLEEPQVKLGEEPADPAKEKAAAVARAKDHLVKTLEVRAEDVTLESAAAASWPDAALGCPEKDRMYAQVVTSGYKVLLKVKGKTHEVHVARSRVVSCPASEPK